MRRISPTYQDAGRVTPSGGASAVPAGWGSSPRLSGGLGKTRPTGITTGLRVQSRWAGIGKARVIPASAVRSRRTSGRGAMRAIFRTIGVARAEQVPGSRVARAERWRSVAAASAVVERREASAPGWARAASQDAEVTQQRLSAFRFPFFFVAWVERQRNPGALRSVEVVPWVSLRSTQATNSPRVIVTSPVPPPAPSDEDHARPLFVCSLGIAQLGRGGVARTAPLNLSPPRGERSSEARVRGRRREFERWDRGDGAGDLMGPLKLAAAPPHPDPLPTQRGEGEDAWPACGFRLAFVTAGA